MISALRQKSNFEFQTFLKKIQIFGFPCCSTREDVSIGASITNVGLILTKLLDVDPQRDDDASPMSTHKCMLRPT